MFKTIYSQNKIDLIAFRIGIFSIATLFMLMFMLPKTSHADFSPLNSQMGFGARSNDVTALQTFLASNPTIYPSGMITGYYGSLTQAAVAQFQAHYGIDQVGRVGPTTLARMNMVINSGTGLDVTAPVIMNSGTQNILGGVMINSTTDTNAQTRIFYSTTPLQMTEATTGFTSPTISGSSTVASSIGVSQSITLSSLLPNTTYYYVIVANDAAGNVSVTNQNTFRTN